VEFEQLAKSVELTGQSLEILCFKLNVQIVIVYLQNVKSVNQLKIVIIVLGMNAVVGMQLILENTSNMY